VPYTVDVPNSATSRGSAGFSDTQDPFGDGTMGHRESVEPVRAYHRIADPALRKQMLELIKSVGRAQG
jgi:hypothetical protein